MMERALMICKCTAAPIQNGAPSWRQKPTVKAKTMATQSARAAALFKVLGGFATNGVNMTKLESYMVGGNFTATQFYAEIEGHPDERHVQLALEELGFFSQSLKILGVFPSSEHTPD